MKIYLAGSYERRAEIDAAGASLVALGHRILSSWHTQQIPPEDYEINPSRRTWSAMQDLAQLKRADVVIVFTERPVEITSAGGTMVELGYALAKEKEIIIVGPAQNCFVDYAAALSLTAVPVWDPAVIAAALQE